MYDRPNESELIDAVRDYLETEILPLVSADSRLKYRTLIAINVLKVAGRENQYFADHLKDEWKRLNQLEEVWLPLRGNPSRACAMLDERNRHLCADIRDGVYDDPARRRTLFQHLLMTTQEQLAVSNPEHLRTLVDEGFGEGSDVYG